MYFYQYLVDNNYYNLHVCHAQFDAQEDGDLNIGEGDVIIEVNRVNEHWLQGQICYDNRTQCWSTTRGYGNFPANHCWPMDPEQVRNFCQERISNHDAEHTQSTDYDSTNKPPPFISRLIPSLAQPAVGPATLPSQSLSSDSSSSQRSCSSDPNHHRPINNNNLNSSQVFNDYHFRSLSASIYSQQHQQHSQTLPPAPPKPPQPHRPSMQQTVELAITKQDKPSSILTTYRHQDKLKGWLNLVKKKTARISTRITASLGLISLTRDEEFERYLDSFKHLEKTIRAFIKNLTTFLEHFENFLQSLQSTSDHLADFYRDKSHYQKELDELRKKNRSLACEHFHSFKRTVDRQVIVVASQLLQKFSGPQQLINKRSAKLLDYDNKSKVLESARGKDSEEKIRDQYVIAKDLYERINNQLKDELPKFNQLALNIFKECVLVLLDSRRELIEAYTKQTASLLDTPLMMTYTASSILMQACEEDEINIIGNVNGDDNCIKNGGETSGHESRLNSANEDYLSRPQSRVSKLSSDFDQMALAAREISSTPLSQVSENRDANLSIKYDEPDAGIGTSDGVEVIDGPQHETESLNDDEPVKRDPPKEKRKKKKVQIYVASWPFVATGPNQLTIGCKQPLKLIKACDECGNSDWSLVQDKKGHLGYVPSSYIKKKE